MQSIKVSVAEAVDEIEKPRLQACRLRRAGGTVVLFVFTAVSCSYSGHYSKFQFSIIHKVTSNKTDM